MAIVSSKQIFLERTRVAAKEHAINNALRAALKRNPTYIAPFQDRIPFRNAFAHQIITCGELYREGIDEDQHNLIIEKIAAQLSGAHGHVLQDGCLRIGTVQKALNLYLKFRWCLEADWPLPPHCPVDNVVLRCAKIPGRWTQLNSISTYKNWISQLKVFALEAGYSSLSEWELNCWNTIIS